MHVLPKNANGLTATEIIVSLIIQIDAKANQSPNTKYRRAVSPSSQVQAHYCIGN
jgi:hypothetical protein